MKGIILAGGKATRLFPISISVSKQLMPIYDKPMIYYPLNILMMSGIKDILIITNEDDQPNFKKLLGDGSNLGIKISYEIQKRPDGIAKAFVIGEKFIGDDDVCLILGDNLFYGNGILNILKKAVNIVKNQKKSVVFGYKVNDPNRYGVIDFDKNKIISIEEKPLNPKSNYAITGLYFYTNEVLKIAKNTQKSLSGEYEITSINQYFLKEGKLDFLMLCHKYKWFDTGTHNSLLEASNFVQKTQLKTGKKIGCIEETSYLNGWIEEKKLSKLAKNFQNTDYGKYLLNISKK